jgi:hypothetical protein
MAGGDGVSRRANVHGPSFLDQHFRVWSRQVNDIADGVPRQIDAVQAMRKLACEPNLHWQLPQGKRNGVRARIPRCWCEPPARNATVRGKSRGRKFEPRL